MSQLIVPFMDLGAQRRSVAAEMQCAIGQVLSHGRFILGPEVEEFEEAFAKFIGVRYGIGLNSGLDALRMSLTALGIGPGDEVIVPANTFAATAFAVTSAGAQPVLADCDAHTYLVDPACVEAAIGPRTRGLMPVHLTGQSADMEVLIRLAEKHGIHVIEDAAQAHGAFYRDGLHQEKRCGSMGAAGCFSFYPSKNLGACGDAGMVTTNDEQLARGLKQHRNYGQSAKYNHVQNGVNSRLDTLHAAVLNVKLPRLDKWNSMRAIHADHYRTLLRGVGDIAFQSQAPYSSHVYHLFIIETSHRDDLAKHLLQAGIETGIHYPKPIHLQTAYADLGHKKGDFPRAERLSERILSLPMFPELTASQIELVADNVCGFFANGGTRSQ
jgi:dTDP-4-amino-4,6-dideoxygalactose transaminase